MSMNHAANRLGLDYRTDAVHFPRLPYPIVDVHSHVHGRRSSAVLKQVAELYGIGLIYSMTPFEQIDSVRRVFGDRIRFIAMPTFRKGSPTYAHGRQFLNRLEGFYQKGVRICKFWSAPRGIDLGIKAKQPDLLLINAPHRIEQMQVARDLGMIFMAHIGDPETWFTTKYADAAVYGTRRSHYDRFEEVLARFDTTPWIAAHMGGWPEDLEFLSDLLTRHPNLYLDTSATKWMVRELSRHSVADLHAFLRRHSGHLMFGSDIVTSDQHESAFDLYASRYWALRTLWETTYHGESPIADPDLHLVDPEHHTEMDAPTLIGRALPPALLRMLYHDAARQLLDPLYSR
ncbi:MAG: amidohydrolase family protein [Candidatus Xenobia bacterium]